MDFKSKIILSGITNIFRPFVCILCVFLVTLPTLAIATYKNQSELQKISIKYDLKKNYAWQEYKNYKLKGHENLTNLISEVPKEEISNPDLFATPSPVPTTQDKPVINLIAEESQSNENNNKSSFKGSFDSRLIKANGFVQEIIRSSGDNTNDRVLRSCQYPVSVSGGRVEYSEENGFEFYDTDNESSPFLKLEKILYLPYYSYVAHRTSLQEDPDEFDVAEAAANDTLIYVRNNDENNYEYYIVESNSDMPLIRQLESRKGSFCTIDNDEAYNPSGSEIQLFNQIAGEIWSANNVLDNAYKIVHNSNIAALYRERYNDLLGEISLFENEDGSAYAAKTGFEQVDLFILKKKIENVIEEFNRLQEESNNLFSAEEQRINSISDPIEKLKAEANLAASRSNFTLDEHEYWQRTSELSGRDWQMDISTLEEFRRQGVDPKEEGIRIAVESINQKVTRLKEPIPSHLFYHYFDDMHFLRLSLVNLINKYKQKINVILDDTNEATKPTDKQRENYIVWLRSLDINLYELGEVNDTLKTSRIPSVPDLIKQYYGNDITDERVDELTYKILSRFSSESIKKVFARVELVNKLKRLDSTRNLPELVYGIDFEFDALGNLNTRNLIDGLANFDNTYFLDPKYNVFFGELEEVLRRQKAILFQEITQENIRMSELAESQLMGIQGLSTFGTMTYSFWTDVSLWFRGNTLGGIIEDADRQVVSHINRLATLIDESQTTMREKMNLLIKIELAEFYFERKLMNLTEYSVNSEYTLVGEWLKFGGEFRTLDPESYLELGEILRGWNRFEYWNYINALYNDNGTNNSFIDAIKAEIPDINNPPSMDDTTPAQRFFVDVYRQLNEIRRLHPSIPFAQSIYENPDYLMPRESYRAVLYALKYSTAYRNYENKFLQLQKPMAKFQILLSATRRESYRSEILAEFGMAAVNELRESLAEINMQNLPLIRSILGNTFSDYGGTSDAGIFPHDFFPTERVLQIGNSVVGVDSMGNRRDIVSSSDSSVLNEYVARHSNKTGKMILALKSACTDTNRDLFTTLDDATFTATTWWNYFKGDFIVQLVAIIGGVLLAFFTGGTSLLAMAAWGTLGGIIGYQVAAEVLWAANAIFGYMSDGTSINEGGYISRWIRRLIRDPPAGFWDVARRFTGEVFFPLVLNFMSGTLITFCTLGIGQAVVRRVNNLGDAVIRRIVGNQAYVRRVATRMAQLESRVSEVARLSTVLREMGQEVREEFIYEEFFKSLFENSAIFTDTFFERLLPDWANSVSSLTIIFLQGARPGIVNGSSLRRAFLVDPKAVTQLTSDLMALNLTVNTNPTGFIDGMPLPTGSITVSNDAGTETETIIPALVSMDNDISEALDLLTAYPTVRQTVDGKYSVKPGIYTFPSLHNAKIIVDNEVLIGLWEVENVLQALNDKIPEHLKGLLFPNLRIVLGKAAENNLAGQRLGNFNPVSLEVRIFVQFSDTDIKEGILFHEIGHLFHTLIVGKDSIAAHAWNDFEAEVAYDAVLRGYASSIGGHEVLNYNNTRYITLRHELFAECFRLYLLECLGLNIPWGNFDQGDNTSFLTTPLNARLLNHIKPLYDHLKLNYFTNTALINEASTRLNETIKARARLSDYIIENIIPAVRSFGNFRVDLDILIKNYIRNLTTDPLLIQELRDIAYKTIKHYISSASGTTHSLLVDSSMPPCELESEASGVRSVTDGQINRALISLNNRILTIQDTLRLAATSQRRVINLVLGLLPRSESNGIKLKIIQDILSLFPGTISRAEFDRRVAFLEAYSEHLATKNISINKSIFSLFEMQCFNAYRELPAAERDYAERQLRIVFGSTLDTRTYNFENLTGIANLVRARNSGEARIEAERAFSSLGGLRSHNIPGVIDMFRDLITSGTSLSDSLLYRNYYDIALARYRVGDSLLQQEFNMCSHCMVDRIGREFIDRTTRTGGYISVIETTLNETTMSIETRYIRGVPNVQELFDAENRPNITQFEWLIRRSGQDSAIPAISIMGGGPYGNLNGLIDEASQQRIAEFQRVVDAFYENPANSALPRLITLIDGEPLPGDTPAAPAEESPAEEPPAEASPAEESPAEEPPAEEPPAEESPAEVPSGEEPPA